MLDEENSTASGDAAGGPAPAAGERPAGGADPLALAFQAPPQPAELPRRRARSGGNRDAGESEPAETGGSDNGKAASRGAGKAHRSTAPSEHTGESGDGAQSAADGDSDGEQSASGSGRRRRGRRGGRGRGRSGADQSGQQDGNADGSPAEASSGSGTEGSDDTGSTRNATTKKQSSRKKKDDGGDQQASAGGEAGTQSSDNGGGSAQDSERSGGDDESSSSRRRRRRRRRGSGGDGEPGSDDPPNTVVKVREPRAEEEIQGVKGSTRMQARRQRRKDGRDSSRRRAPVVTEAEFLARRESVERMMVVRESDDRTQIAVLEDGVLVEHYVTRGRNASSVGNVYLGRVQNVLPSMEAAFVDIGRGRNGVLYAGEVDYDAEGVDGKPHRIEQALKSGQSVPVQVSKDPIGHKGARLTGQISLPGRFMVLVPGGHTTGISRKLPDTERSRLKGILKKVIPDDAGIILRTAAEGASEEQLTRDLARLRAQWEAIEKKAGSVSPPAALYTEPDLAIRVIRDVFNEDFTSLVVDGDDEWNNVEAYVDHVAPELAERVSQWGEDGDVFAAYRIDEQLAKALERKVWLPSGGYLIIDRTEAMVVVDVNTGKFTGQGGNLEETVTKTNLEAAEEVVRQLRLRDLGGIVVIDFIDMVLETNRDLVLRRLVECLGRDRTRHQVAEVTSLGLVQMTRKRVGEGLLEAFSETCPDCHGRGVRMTVDPTAPAEPKRRHTSSTSTPAAPKPEPAPAGSR
jgi:ribonuclease E